jgi:hypothetical protein
MSKCYYLPHANASVICHCTATAPMLSATRPTLMLGQNLALKLHQFMLQININLSKYLLRKFLRFFTKSTSISDYIYLHRQDYLGSRDKIYLDLTKIYVHYNFMEATLDTNFELNCSQQRILGTRCHRLTVGLSRHARVARKKKTFSSFFFAQSRTLNFFNDCRELH